MQTLRLTYRYREDDEAQLNTLLGGLESELGGERKSCKGGKADIDLVKYLELTVVFTAGLVLNTVLSKYFEGFFRGDSLKRLGEAHRKKVSDWFSQLQTDLSAVVKRVQDVLTLEAPNITFDGERRALALTFRFERCELFVVLDHENRSARLMFRLPQAVVRAIRFLAENKMPEDVRVLQLYFDKSSEHWKYLFMPSTRGIAGQLIDRYVDLDTGEIKTIQSRDEFRRIFQPHPADEWKFLQNPFRE